MSAEPMTALPVVGIGSRGARYVSVESTSDPAFSVVTTTGGRRYVVETSSIDLGGVR